MCKLPEKEVLTVKFFCNPFVSIIYLTTFWQHYEILRVSFHIKLLLYYLKLDIIIICIFKIIGEVCRSFCMTDITDLYDLRTIFLLYKDLKCHDGSDDEIYDI